MQSKIVAWDYFHKTENCGFIKKCCFFKFEVIHRATWNCCCTTVVTENWAEWFPTALVLLGMLPWRHVLYSDILNNGQSQCSMWSETLFSADWCRFSSPVVHVCIRSSEIGLTDAIERPKFFPYVHLTL